jgi:hypothetical protein
MIQLSATSMATFKACPFRYYYKYVLGLTPIEDTDSLRMGTNWHRIQEIANMEPSGVCECVTIHGADQDSEVANPNCPLCGGTGQFPDDPMDAVIAHLNQVYAVPPISKTVEEWETERIILLYSLIGYRWYYQDTGYEVESLEQTFKLPLLSPITGRKLQANLKGKIDRVFSAGVNRFVHEYKSTSKNIDPDSTYWNHLTLDTQTRLYTYAANQLGLGMCGVLYDVWSKPKSRPKKLTQAESKRFVADGEYCGEKFEVANTTEGGIVVNGKEAQVEPGAKEGTFAIRETPEMYGARLLQDITERPEFYFARKEIIHNADDIKAFEWELFNIYQNIRQMSNRNMWWRDESACEATYKCSYIDWCYNNIKIGPDDVPENFQKRGGE